MTAYRAGQRIRIEWEGLVTEGRGFAGGAPVPCVDVPGYGRVFLSEGKHLNITVLSEPRPDEPTGLGAVVEAGVKWDTVRAKWVQTARHNPTPSWYRVGRTGSADWDELIDPVVLSEGLTS